MKFKSFFWFFYTFLGIISAITVPVLIHEQNYKKLAIFSVILCFLLVVSISLYIFFSRMATGFDVSADNIFLHYSASSKTIQIANVDRILISDYQYSVHMKSGEKYYITRISGSFKLEAHIDPRISRLSSEYGISIEMK